MQGLFGDLAEALGKASGYIYPNDIELQWGILIVLYPYITGLVAGAFILASLEKVFNVETVKPTYRLSLLTAFAFLLAAPLPLLLHIGHPERSFSLFLTPHMSSAMAIFGFVYVWYLMVVLVLEIWLEYRRDIVIWAGRDKSAVKKAIYAVLSLGISEVTPRSVRIDAALAKIVTVIGLPSAILLHGYVGFIFGSVKANPWWSTPLMPVIFLFSAMASGIALVLVLYIAAGKIRKARADISCLDTMGRYLLIALIVSFSLEMLEMIQKAYEAEEHFAIISLLAEGKLYISLFLVQIALGSVAPIIILGLVQILKASLRARTAAYASSAVLVLVGVFAMRWNVVVGGQFFSKSLSGFTTYKLNFVGLEGILSAAAIMAVPFLVLGFMVVLLPPWAKPAVKEDAVLDHAA